MVLDSGSGSGSSQPRDILRWKCLGCPRVTFSRPRSTSSGQALRDSFCNRLVLTQTLKPVLFRIFLSGRKLFRRSFQRFGTERDRLMGFARISCRPFGVGQLHAAFLNESRIRGRWWRPVAGNSGRPSISAHVRWGRTWGTRPGEACGWMAKASRLLPKLPALEPRSINEYLCDALHSLGPRQSVSSSYA
jgi:hypothetical protein